MSSFFWLKRVVPAGLSSTPSPLLRGDVAEGDREVVFTLGNASLTGATGGRICKGISVKSSFPPAACPFSIFAFSSPTFSSAIKSEILIFAGLTPGGTGASGCLASPVSLDKVAVCWFM
ncbi:MAG: hypothetical protein M1383_05490 [Patescibacteria group bacterium]|nr:hypothetical protein [Patescibacteria group bacterium]